MYKTPVLWHIIYIPKGSVFVKKFIYRIFTKREKGYYFLLFFIFVTMVVSQVLMRKDGMMGYFSAIETFEGEFISDEDMFNKEEIVIEYKGELPEPLPEIYLNGERVGFLDEKKKPVIIETDSVLEIFFEEDISGASAQVKYDDEEMINYVKGYPVNLHRGYNIVARFSFLS